MQADLKNEGELSAGRGLAPKKSEKNYASCAIPRNER
jgi:hypothetical protein